MRIYVLLLGVLHVNSISSHLQYNRICKNNSTDCSSLITNENGPFSGCYMTRTSECKRNAKMWTNESVSMVTAEDDLGFSVTVYAYRPDDGIAYNLTITNPSQNIKGFLMNFRHIHGTANVSSCRIFDFRELPTTFKYPLSFYYDCLVKLSFVNEEHLRTELTVRSLPNNRQVVYWVNVPKIPNEDVDCDSETLVMYLVSALDQNKVSIKFQKCPRVLQYKVKLISLHNSLVIEKKILDVQHTDGKEMVSTVFENVDRGEYNISVEHLSEDKKQCAITYVKVVINKRLPNYSYIGWIVGTIIFISLVVIVTFYFIKRKQKSMLKPQQKHLNILLVYHPDNSKLLDLLHCVAEYLKTLIPCKILTAWELVNENATEWIVTSFNSADVIVIVLSNGIVTNNIDMPVPPSYGSLFWPMCRNICDELIWKPESSSKKIFIKVCFENYDSSNTPNELKLPKLGPKYTLMKDFKKVFCRMTERSTFWSHFYQLPEFNRQSKPDTT